MFAVDFESGIVGLTWPFDEPLPRPDEYFDRANRQTVYWTVEGDSLENLSVDVAGGPGGAEGQIYKLAPDKWGINADHGQWADLVRVRNLKRVTIESAVVERPMLVGTNAEYVTPEEPVRPGQNVYQGTACRKYDFVDVITDKDTPLSLPQGVQAIVTPTNVAVGAGIVGGAAAVTKALDWW